MMGLQQGHATTLRRNDTTTDEKRTGWNDLESNGEVQTNEDRVYLQLISEKIKSATDWDFRDARTFRLG